MPLRMASLGLKLNLALLSFLVILGAATSAILVYGFNRTQEDAHDRSQAALEQLGSLALSAVAEGVAEQAGVQFESASEVGQRAARFMESFRQAGVASPLSAESIVRTDEGLYYDPRPSRMSDFVALPGVILDDPAVRDEVAYVAALDTAFESLYESFEDEVGGRNFDPVAIGFVGVERTGRYYPPRDIHQFVAPDVDVSNVLDRVGPTANPTRRTTWGVPYQDNLGQGLVVTAETPVYEGDRFRGVIQVDLLIERMIEQINLVHPTESGFAFYVDPDGNLLRTEAYDLLTRLAGDDGRLAAVLGSMQAADAQRGVVVDEVNLEGEPFLIAHTSMPSLGGSIAVAAPVSEITAEASAITAGIDEEGTRTLRAMLAAMGAIFLAGLAALGYLNRRVLVSPIAELLAGTRSVGTGDLDTQIPVRSADELGALAEGFNAMVTDLRTRSTALAKEVREREDAQSELSAPFMAMEDVVLILDADGRCLRVAPTHSDRRYAPGPDVVGRTLHEVMPNVQADAVVDRIRAALENGASQALDYAVDGPDGERWFAAAITPMGSERVVYLSRDITEQVRAEQLLGQRVEERTRQLQLLLDVSADVASTLDLRELAVRILDQLREVVVYDGAGVLLVEGGELVILEAREPEGVSDAIMVGRRFALPMPGPAGDAIVQRDAVIIADVASDEALHAQLLTVRGSFTNGRSWLAVPLIAQGRVVGVLTLWSASPGAYTRQDADLAMAVASQAAVAIENARLYQQASSVAALEERQRLARELHDSVSQALYGIALGAQTARQLVGPEAPATQSVEYVLSLAEAGLAEMRALIFELRPESLATEGLVSALEKQAAAIRARYGLDVAAALSTEPKVSLAAKEALYRIAQEAMHNTIKHARATRIGLRLDTVDGDLRLEVADDGVGFDASGDFPGHLGLRSMRERIEAVRGGSLSIEARPGGGTRLTATVPLH